MVKSFRLLQNLKIAVKSPAIKKDPLRLFTMKVMVGIGNVVLVFLNKIYLKSTNHKKKEIGWAQKGIQLEPKMKFSSLR